MWYECVIIGEGQRVLCVSQMGNWSLPRVECEAGWLPNAVSSIQAELARRFGLASFVLRELERVATAAFVEVEALGPERPGIADAAWHDPETAIGLLPAESAVVLAGCRRPRPAHLRGGPWQQRGWYSEARAWSLSALEAAGWAPEAEPPRVRQIKGGWHVSVILELSTASGRVFFKAVPRRQPGESKVLATLAERFPAHLPRLVAADAERGFFLMREITGAALDHDDEASLAAAMRLMASIQIQEAERLERWREMGCIDHGLGVLEARLERLLCEIPSKLAEQGVIDRSEVALLGAFVPRARLSCQRLASLSPVPCSIHHEDFRAGNVHRTPEGELVIIDWNETVLSHPFFSAQRLLWFIDPPEGAGRHRLIERASDRLRCALRDAYLEPFSRLAEPDALREAFRLSCSVAPLYDALRFDAGGETEAAFERGLSRHEQRTARGLIDQLLEVAVDDQRQRASGGRRCMRPLGWFRNAGAWLAHAAAAPRARS